jgi:hypothetical protein
MIGLLVAVASPAAAQYYYPYPPDPETQFYDRELKRMQWEDELRNRNIQWEKEHGINTEEQRRGEEAARRYIEEHPLFREPFNKPN